MSIIDYIVAQNYRYVGSRKIKLKDYKKDGTNTIYDIRIVYSRNKPTRYIHILPLEYIITKVFFLGTYARYTTPISYYRKRDVNDS